MTTSDADAAPVVRDPALVEDALWRKAQAGDVAQQGSYERGEKGEESSDVDPWKLLTREQRDELLRLLDDRMTYPPQHEPLRSGSFRARSIGRVAL